MVSVKQVAVFGLACAIALSSTGCSVVLGERVDPGKVGLLVNNYGNERGVENATLVQSGRVRVAPGQSLYEYPVFFQSYPFEVSVSMSGSPATFYLAATYRYRQEQIEGEKPGVTWVHRFFEQFRVDPDKFNATVFSQALRDCANAATSEIPAVELATKPASLTNPVKECLQAKYPELEIRELSLTQSPQLPETVQNSINAAFKARQEAETAQANKLKAEAEAAAKLAEATGEANAQIERARGQSEANRLITESLNPNLIEYQRIQNQREIEELRWNKWNGQMAPVNQAPVIQQAAPAQ